MDKKFYWYSQKIFTYDDYVNNIKLFLNFENGYNTETFSHPDPRVNVIIKNESIGGPNSSNNYELYFKDIANILNYLKVIVTSKQNNTKKPDFIISRNKNNKKELEFIFKDEKLFLSLTNDSNTLSIPLLGNIENQIYACLENVYKNFSTNCILSRSTISQEITNDLLIELVKINKGTYSKINSFENNNYKDDSFNEQYLKGKKILMEQNNFPDILEETKKEIINDLNPISFVINDDILKNIKLEGEDELERDLKNKKFNNEIEFIEDNNLNSKVLKENKKEINKNNRPFINGMLNNKLENLYKWLDGICFSEYESNDNCFTPFGSSILNLSYEDRDLIYNLEDYFNYEYYLVSLIKDTYNKITKSENPVDIDIYQFKNLKIKRNTSLWNFTVDIGYVCSVMKIYEFFRNKIKTYNSFLDVNEIPTSMFCKIISTTLISSIDKNDIDSYINDVTNLINEKQNLSFFDVLYNHYSEFSINGKMNITKENINNTIGKIINAIDKRKKITIDNFDKFFEEYNIKIKHIKNLEDIKNEICIQNKEEKQNNDIEKTTKKINEIPTIEKEVVKNKSKENYDKLFSIEDDEESINEYKNLEKAFLGLEG